MTTARNPQSHMPEAHIAAATAGHRMAGMEPSEYGIEIGRRQLRGEICSQCRRVFGDMIRPVSERERAETSDHPRPAATGPQVLTRRNQRCWLCEQRRTCTRVGGQWECRDCTLPAAR